MYEGCEYILSYEKRIEQKMPRPRKDANAANAVKPLTLNQEIAFQALLIEILEDADIISAHEIPADLTRHYRKNLMGMKRKLLSLEERKFDVESNGHSADV
jgi:hypothetical protein